MAIQEIALTTSRASGISLIDRLHGLVVTVDHKKLGLMYIGTALVFLVVAGLMAVAIRLQLAVPNNTLLGPEVFNRFFTMHGTAMVFLVGMPIIAGLGNYLVPLMIGTRDMAFPRLNAFGYWMFVFGALLLYFSYLGAPGLNGHGSAPDVGWFAYAPLTGRAFSRGHSTDYWILSLWKHLVGHKRDRDCSYNALSWADLDAHAALRLDDDRHELHDHPGVALTLGSADHVAG